MSGEYIISANDLSVGYEDPLIEHICFNLREGEIMTLIGPNGSGKSTILKTVCGHLRKHAGIVYVDGKNASDMTPDESARKMAVLLTDRPRPDLMTCREVVETGRYPYTGRFGLLSEADKAAVNEAIESVNMQDFADRDFTEISDGQRQRVMLARAICQEPKILILDEPTSFLDIYHKIAFLEILKKLTGVKKPAVLVSMHELELAKKISDYTICVKNGKVFKSGNPEEIFREDVICKLFGINRELYNEYYSGL